MSTTRGLICLYYKGFSGFTYDTQFDRCRYPSGHGPTILKFLLHPGNIEALKKGLNHVYIPSMKELQQIFKEVETIDKFVSRPIDPKLTMSKLFP